jgi:hypothetical protein
MSPRKKSSILKFLDPTCPTLPCLNFQKKMFKSFQLFLVKSNVNHPAYHKIPLFRLPMSFPSTLNQQKKIFQRKNHVSHIICNFPMTAGITQKDQKYIDVVPRELLQNIKSGCLTNTYFHKIWTCHHSP